MTGWKIDAQGKLLQPPHPLTIAGIPCSLAVSLSGDRLFIGGYGRLLCIASHGEIIWQRRIFPGSETWFLRPQPDGSVIVGSSHQVCALNAAGRMRWRIEVDTGGSVQRRIWPLPGDQLAIWSRDSLITLDAAGQPCAPLLALNVDLQHGNSSFPQAAFTTQGRAVVMRWDGATPATPVRAVGLEPGSRPQWQLHFPAGYELLAYTDEGLLYGLEPIAATGSQPAGPDDMQIVCRRVRLPVSIGDNAAVGQARH
jgi:hypothetical protein